MNEVDSKPKLPKGIRARTTKKGVVYDALIYEGGKQISIGTGATPEEAVTFRHEYYRDKQTEGDVMPRDIGVLTLRELGRLYNVAHPMPRWDYSRWKSRVEGLADFIDWPITQISQDDCRVWIAKMARTPIATGKSAGKLPTRGTLQAAICTLRGVFVWACMPDPGYLKINPMPLEEVTISTSTKAKPETERTPFMYLLEAEARKVYEAPDSLVGLKPKTIYLTLMFSGARPGDVYRLEWHHVDFEENTLTLRSRKTNRVYRVRMLPKLREALLKWHLACGRRTSGLVFPNDKGKVFGVGYDAGWADVKFRQNTYKRDPNGKHKNGKGHAAVKTKAKAVSVKRGHRHKFGITREAPLYSLRHTLASHLLLGTEWFTGGRQWSPIEVQSQLGHKDSTATERYMQSLNIMNFRASDESAAAIKATKAKGRKR